MRHRHHGNRGVLGVKVEYVESKLDETIKDFKEAIAKSDLRHDEAMKSLKEEIAKSEARLEADRLAYERRQEATEKRIENERIAAENRLAADREEFNRRFAEERKEWRSHKRWMYLNFGGLIALIVTVVLALINGSIPNN